MPTKISVVVTNYNYGHFLSRCLRSLLDQTLPQDQYEVIVVDDGSTDNSKQVLALFTKDTTQILLEKNFGLSYAANQALRKVKSRYVVRVDADDFVHPNFLEQFLLGFELVGNMCEAVSCDYSKVLVDGTFEGIGSQLTEPIACGVAFKFEVLEFLGYYNEELRIYEEVDFMERFKTAGFRIHHLNLPLYRYVQHGDSLTSGVFR
jgi:glycosyltransferase involved in cell wall biosynthesis